MIRSPDEKDVAAFVAEAGVPYVRGGGGNPIDEWLALMEVVEALCPRWPERAPAMGGRFEL